MQDIHISHESHESCVLITPPRALWNRNRQSQFLLKAKTFVGVLFELVSISWKQLRVAVTYLVYSFIEQLKWKRECGGTISIVNSCVSNKSSQIIKSFSHLSKGTNKASNTPQTKMHTNSEIIFGHNFSCSLTWCDPFCSVC